MDFSSTCFSGRLVSTIGAADLPESSSVVTVFPVTRHLSVTFQYLIVRSLIQH